jgi:hypothetical protein
MRKNIFNLAICAIFCGLAIVGGKLVIPAGPIHSPSRPRFAL